MPKTSKLIFEVNRECPNVEKERLGIKPTKSEVDKDGIIDEEFDRTWSCSTMEDVPVDIIEKIDQTLGKLL